MKTSLSDKIKMMKVVSGKLKQEETKNFKFYQAYHHKNGQEIEIELLQNIVSFLNHAAP